MHKALVENIGNPLFIFAHPDDELYCCTLMQAVQKANNNVRIIYITSGSMGGVSKIRETEVTESMAAVGVPMKQVLFLRVLETKIMDNVGATLTKVLDLVKDNPPDVVIGQDFEGGHEGHDIASFIASEVANALKSRHIVFPSYHGKPTERKGARFKPERTNYTSVTLNAAEQELKHAIIRAHKTQKNHFDKIKLASADYRTLLFSREVFTEIIDPIHYLEKPSSVVGYEFHGNGFIFEQFRQTIVRYYATKNTQLH